MKKIITLTISNIFTVFLFAQIGINTDAPIASLTVVSPHASESILNITNSDNKPLLTLDYRGYLGIGIPTPTVKLDLRSNIFTDNNILGLGTTSLTAVQAQEGALRYDNNILQYSDGIQWKSISTSQLQKVYILANNNNPNQTTLYDPGSGSGVAEIINNWTVVEQQGISFDAATGTFIAPRNGIYSISVTALFSVKNASTNAGIELDVLTSNSVFRIGKSYVGVPLSNPNFDVTIVNKVYISLNTGDTLNISCWFAAGAGSTITLSPNATFNILTIAEM